MQAKLATGLGQSRQGAEDLGFRGRNPVVISLLHATRGRPEEAKRCRALWLETATRRERVQHIFAVDGDDEASQRALAPFQPRVVTSPGLGCVGAWNLAAQHAEGEILVQLSDDWLPPRAWDEALAERLPLDAPAVLRVNDGHRTDDLLCMAVLNRARLSAVGEVLASAYTGLFSDDEFSFRAFEDGVVVDGRDLVFEHDHPAFNPAKVFDRTYAEQNDGERFRSALEVFLARNPDAEERWFSRSNNVRRFIPRAEHEAMKNLAKALSRLFSVSEEFRELLEEERIARP